MDVAPRPQMRPVRVLIADDEPLFVETVQAILSGDDRVEVVGTAGNGQVAVDNERCTGVMAGQAVP